MTEEENKNALSALENLVAEFFLPETGNERKRQIEILLESFSEQPQSFSLCCYCLRSSENYYVLMYILNTLEKIVSRKWNHLNESEKNDLRLNIWLQLTDDYSKFPSFLRNKLSKLICDIARRNWPGGPQVFLNSILELIYNGGKSSIVGLLILKNLTEMFDGIVITQNEVVLGKNRDLENAVVLMLPTFIHILTEILRILSQNRLSDGRISDPPPSPERGADPVQVSILPNNLNPITKTKLVQDELVEECVRLCLNNLQNLFSWLPSNTQLPPALIDVIFFWTSEIAYEEFDEEIAILALSTINELFYRKMFPSGAAFTMPLARSAVKLLQSLVMCPRGTSFMNTMSLQYVDKISEYLKLFISIHFKRLEAETTTESLQFLSLIFKYTFQIPNCLSFITCLEIWTQFVEDLKPQDFPKYSDALIELVKSILRKIQYQHNYSQLISFDKEILNDDGETEWQIFLKNCIECVAKIAEHSPLLIFNICMEVWQQLSLQTNSISRDQLHDFASLTQLLGRLAPTLFLDSNKSTSAQSILKAKTFIESLMNHIIQVSAINRRMLQQQPKPIIDAVELVYAGLLACIGGILPYVSRDLIQSPVLLKRIVPLLMPPELDAQDIVVAEMLSHSAAHLLLSMAVMIKPAGTIQQIESLFIQAQRSFSHLPPKTAAVLRQALCVVILECPEDNTDNQERGRRCAALIEAWCAPLLNGEGTLKMACSNCLPLLTDLLKYFANHNSQTKKMLTTAVERPVQAAMMAFQNSNCDSQVTTLVLDLYLALLGSLHQQLGTNFAHQSIRLFLDVAKRQESGALQRLLQLLQLGVEGGILGGEAALSEVITLCLDHILPLIESESVDSDVIYAFFDLFGSILLNRWQYFYSSCVRLGWSPAADVSPEDDGEKKAHSTQFCRIVQAIVASFMLNHIEVFRLNLTTLDRLNTRWKLYQKTIFQQNMLDNLLAVLIGSLMRKATAASLLQEEVLNTCHALAAVNFNSYFNKFLPSFLKSMAFMQYENIHEILQRPQDTDLPSFSRNLLKTINEIRYYEMTCV